MKGEQVYLQPVGTWCDSTEVAACVSVHCTPRRSLLSLVTFCRDDLALASVQMAMEGTGRLRTYEQPRRSIACPLASQRNGTVLKRGLMKKRKSVITAVAIASGLIVVAFLYFRARSGPSSPGARPSPAVVQRMEGQNRTAFKSALDQFAARLQAARSALNSGNTGESELQLRVGVLKEAFSKMHDANRMLARDELRGAIMDDLIAEPGYLDLMTRVVVDWHYAESLFGKDQALARVSSIATLKHAAERGDTAPIETALSGLGGKMNEEQSWEKGMQHDYTDLIAGYINVQDTDKFLQDPQHFFELVKMSDRLSNQIATGIYDSKLRAIPPDVLRERLGRYFPAPTQPQSRNL